MIPWHRLQFLVRECFIAAVVTVLGLIGSGCVTRSQAEAKARQAFMAGQQQALDRMRQAQGPCVTVMGQVRKPIIAWSEELTLGKAVLEAGYLPPHDPREILIVRKGQAFRVDPAKLLSGEDIPLQDGDVVQLADP